MSDGQFRAHMIQTFVILLPTLGALVLIYVTIRTDLAKALDDNTRQDVAIAKIEREEKESAIEARATWREVRDLLASIQRDAAVSAALGKKGR